MGCMRLSWAKTPPKHPDATTSCHPLNYGARCVSFRTLSVVESWQFCVISGHNKHDCGAEDENEINDEAQRGNVQQSANSRPDKDAEQCKNQRHCQCIHHEIRYAPKRCRPLFLRHRRLARRFVDSTLRRSDAGLICHCCGPMNRPVNSTWCPDRSVRWYPA